MKFLKNMLSNADSAIEILYYLMNMNLLAFHVVTIKLNENTNSLKGNEKNKFHKWIEIC